MPARGVHDVLDHLSCDAGLLQEVPCAVDDGEGVVVRGRQHLLRPHRAVAPDQHDVRERAAVVDAELEEIARLALNRNGPLPLTQVPPLPEDRSPDQTEVRERDPSR